MTKETELREEIEKAYIIYCRVCGCEYLESIEWVDKDGKTECPNCNNKLRIF